MLLLRQWKVYVLPTFRHKTNTAARQKTLGEMNKRKLGSFGLSVMLIALGVTAEAQQPKKVPRIGYLGGASLSANVTRIEAFKQGLRELGYVEGKNIVIEYRYAEEKFDHLCTLAAELVA